MLKVNLAPNAMHAGFLGAFGAFFGWLAACLVCCLLIGGCLIALTVFERSHNFSPRSTESTTLSDLPTPATAIHHPPAQSPRVPPPDPSIEFRRRVVAFLTEAKALVRYCSTEIDFEPYATKCDRVDELYNQIPEPPPKYAALYTKLSQIKHDLAVERYRRQFDDKTIGPHPPHEQWTKAFMVA